MFTWHSPCFSLHIVFLLHMSLCPNCYFLYEHQSFWINTHPKGITLTDDLCKDPISKQGYILRYLRLGIHHKNLVGWHHWLNGHEFDKTPGDGQGQGSLACCSPWGRKELDTTEQLNNIRIWGDTAGTRVTPKQITPLNTSYRTQFHASAITSTPLITEGAILHYSRW